jgi:hypothetical protein
MNDRCEEAVWGVTQITAPEGRLDFHVVLVQLIADCQMSIRIVGARFLVN